MSIGVSLLLIIGALVVLDICAALWGVDSREGVNSPEFERMQAWFRR